jgi:hypothetical protein
VDAETATIAVTVISWPSTKVLQAKDILHRMLRESCDGMQVSLSAVVAIRGEVRRGGETKP